MAATERDGPVLVRPMLAVAGPLPPPPGVEGEWAYELKWDGVRAVAYTGPRAGPESLRLLGAMKLGVILEGVHARHLGGHTLGDGHAGVGPAVPVLARRGLRLLAGADA